MDLTKVKDNAIDGLALALGVSGSAIAIAAAKGKVPYWVEPLVGIVPGLALAIMVDDKRAKSFGKGFLTVGIIDLANKGTSKVAALAPVNKFIPKIAGLGRLGEAAYVAPQPELLSGFAGLGAGADQLLLS